MHDKATNTHHCTIQFVPDYCKMLVDVFLHLFLSEDAFMLVYFPDRYKTQRMCNEAVDDYLATLKLTPDSFVTSMIQK